MPKKLTSSYICQQCGYRSPQFLGKCPECGSWNSLVEQVEQVTKINGPQRTTKSIEIIRLKDIEQKNYSKLITQIGEFNRVLGGGIVLGSVILVSGDPGIGKSTLLSQIALEFVQTLYVAGEESAHQIKIRIGRINSKADLAVLAETDVDLITRAVEQFKPSLVIVDSIQTLETQDLISPAGSVSQVRETAHRLQQLAKRLHIPIIIVGHVTKEGNLAGPRTLEHLVDVVLSLEGDPNSNFRILRTTKNRFGPTDEVGIFEMEETGMVEVKNPSKLFLDQRVNAPGSAVTAVLNGLRPITVEIQALVTKTNLAIPRRVGTGVDNNRLQLLVAVLSKRLKLPLFDQDVFVNVTGGIKVTEPAADLAICAAIVSSFKDQPLPPETVFIGEVGLLGELRAVRQLDKRTTEAKKLGFANVISSGKARDLKSALDGLIKS